VPTTVAAWGPDHPGAARGIAIDPSGSPLAPRIREHVADLVIRIGDRERSAPGPIGPCRTGQPIEGVIAKVLIAVERIRDEIHIPIGGKGIGEVLIERIRPSSGS
jgi:hypothetical protein